MADNPTVLGFLRAIWSDWGSRMSGALTVPFSALAVFVDPKYGQRIWIALALVSLLLMLYIVWGHERSCVVTLKEKLRPKLKTHFDCHASDCVVDTALSLREGTSLGGATSTSSQMVAVFPPLATLSPTGPRASIAYAPKIPCTYYRIRVEADSINEVASCHGHLLSVGKWELDGRYTNIYDSDSLDLTFAPAERSDTLSKLIRNGIAEHLDFLVITDDDRVFLPVPNFETYTSANADKMFGKPASPVKAGWIGEFLICSL